MMKQKLQMLRSAYYPMFFFEPLCVGTFSQLLSFCLAQNFNFKFLLNATITKVLFLASKITDQK